MRIEWLHDASYEMDRPHLQSPSRIICSSDLPSCVPARPLDCRHQGILVLNITSLDFVDDFVDICHSRAVQVETHGFPMLSFSHPVPIVSESEGNQRDGVMPGQFVGWLHDGMFTFARGRTTSTFNNPACINSRDRIPVLKRVR